VSPHPRPLHREAGFWILVAESMVGETNTKLRDEFYDMDIANFPRFTAFRAILPLIVNPWSPQPENLTGDPYSGRRSHKHSIIITLSTMSADHLQRQCRPRILFSGKWTRKGQYLCIDK
jgi:hypothetical protein